MKLEEPWFNYWPVIIVISACIIVTSSVVIYFWFDMPFMEGDDPCNPLNYSNLYITNGVKVVADINVERTDSPHEKTIKYMEWIDHYIDVNKKPYPGNISYPHVIIEQHRGLCGAFSILSVAFLTTQDIPAHLIVMCGENGHVAFEVYYGGEWHYYDPTFSAYWVENGTILSFEDLKNGGARTAELVVGNMTRYNLYHGEVPIYLTHEIYETYYPSGVVTKECPLISNCKPCKVSE